MSTEAMPPEGKYVKNDTTKSALAEGTLLKLMKLGLGCRIDWPKEGTALVWCTTAYFQRITSSSMKWRRVRQCQ